MMLRSSDNTDQINEEYHDPTGLETPSRAQLPRMLSMTLAEFDERIAEAIRAQTHNLVTSSTTNRQNPSTPNRPRRGSHAEEARERTTRPTFQAKMPGQMFSSRLMHDLTLNSQLSSLHSGTLLSAPSSLHSKILFAVAVGTKLIGQSLPASLL